MRLHLQLKVVPRVMSDFLFLFFSRWVWIQTLACISRLSCRSWCQHWGTQRALSAHREGSARLMRRSAYVLRTTRLFRRLSELFVCPHPLREGTLHLSTAQITLQDTTPTIRMGHQGATIKSQNTHEKGNKLNRDAITCQSGKGLPFTLSASLFNWGGFFLPFFFGI